MKIAKFIAGAALVVALAFGGAGQAQAQPFLQTLVNGVVYDGSGNPITTGGTVNVTCGTGNQTVSINPDGSYSAFFPQSQCITGNTATATASTSQGSGSGSDVVEDTIVQGPFVDIDIAVVNITVPEFGLIGGVAMMIGAAALYAKTRTQKAFVQS